MRISHSNQALPAVQRGQSFTVEVDGKTIEAFAGETIAAALLAAGIRVFRRTAKKGSPRSIYCGMGICHACLVTVDGTPNIRACVTSVTPGMKIATTKQMTVASPTENIEQGGKNDPEC